MEIFVRMMDALAAEKAELQTIMIDATYLKVHHTASSLRLKKEIQVACSDGQPLRFFMTAKQTSNDAGAPTHLDSLPAAQ